MRSFIVMVVVAAIVAVSQGCTFSVHECGDAYCAPGEPSSCPSDCRPEPAPYCGDFRAPEPYGVYLGVTYRPAPCESWSWAASVSMIADYYGRGMSVCGYTSDLTGYECCDHVCDGTACDASPRPEAISALMGGIVGIHGFEEGAPVSEGRLQTELSNGRPVMLGYFDRWTAHVVVVYGYHASYGHWFYSYHDPAYHSYAVTYDQLFYGARGPHWSTTWTGLSPWPNGCNYDFDHACGC